MNATNGDLGTGVGTGSGADTDQVRDHLRSARDAATEAARTRARQAQSWARSQLEDLQDRVESQPYQASAWALGAGFLAGILLMSLLRSGRN